MDSGDGDGDDVGDDGEEDGGMILMSIMKMTELVVIKNVIMNEAQ